MLRHVGHHLRPIQQAAPPGSEIAGLNPGSERRGMLKSPAQHGFMPLSLK